jgi:hypothetical protein
MRNGSFRCEMRIIVEKWGLCICTSLLPNGHHPTFRVSSCMARTHQGPSSVKLWTPQLRLYEEDAAIFQQEPFTSIFAQHRDARTRHKPTLWQQLMSTLAEVRFVGAVCPFQTLAKSRMQVVHISDWLCFTLGAQIVDHMPPEAVVKAGELFLEVLYTRYLHGDTTEGDNLASELLLRAQTDNFKKYYRELVRLYIRFYYLYTIDR